MLANFRAHEQVFNTVIEMAAKNEKLTRVDFDWTDPSDPAGIGIDPEKVEEFRRLLAEVNVPRGFQADPESKEVDFIYWGTGSAMTDDFTKGYAYLSAPPVRTAPSLDRIQLDGLGRQVVYRPIQGHWYLYLELIPD
jgi:hypothetical protein